MSRRDRRSRRFVIAPGVGEPVVRQTPPPARIPGWQPEPQLHLYAEAIRVAVQYSTRCGPGFAFGSRRSGGHSQARTASSWSGGPPGKGRAPASLAGERRRPIFVRRFGKVAIGRAENSKPQALRALHCDSKGVERSGGYCGGSPDCPPLPLLGALFSRGRSLSTGASDCPRSPLPGALSSRGRSRSPPAGVPWKDWP